MTSFIFITCALRENNGNKTRIKEAFFGPKKVLKKKLFWGTPLFLVFWGFQNTRIMVNTHYPLPNFFADQINLEYFMRFSAV